MCTRMGQQWKKYVTAIVQAGDQPCPVEGRMGDTRVDARELHSTLHVMKTGIHGSEAKDPCMPTRMRQKWKISETKIVQAWDQACRLEGRMGDARVDEREMHPTPYAMKTATQCSAAKAP